MDDGIPMQKPQSFCNLTQEVQFGEQRHGLTSILQQILHIAILTVHHEQIFLVLVLKAMIESTDVRIHLVLNKR